MGDNKKLKFSPQLQTCKFSSRLLLVRPSLLRSSHLTPSRMSRPRSRTRRESHQTNRDLSSPVSSSRMEEPSPTTTSRRNPLSISSSDSEEVCRSSSRLSLERPSPSRLSHLTPLRTSRPRSRTRRESHQINKDLSSPVSNSRMEELSPTTTSRRSPPSISSSDSEEVCRSSLRLSLERPSPLRTSRPRSRTRRESHLINRDSSSLESSSRTEELFLTTTSRRSPLSISSLDSEEDSEVHSRSKLLSNHPYEPTIFII